MTFIRITIFLSIFTIPIIVSSSNLSLSNDLSTKALKETEKDLDNAILLIQQSLVLEPNNAKAWAIAGQIYLLNEDILSAEELFFTGTAAEVVPITQVNSQKIGSGMRGEATEILQKNYFDQVRGKRSSFPEWHTLVS